MELVKEPAQERRGLDYVTAVYSAATERVQQEQFDALVAISEDVAPNWVISERGASRHYERCFATECGFRIELTEVGGLRPANCGNLCVSYPGIFWWSPTDEVAALNVLKMSQIEGFKHFTRLDFQNTELEPEWDAYRVRDAVTQGEVWVKGASTYRDYMDRDADGTPTNGLTMYWGSVRSEKLGRSYDKAKNASWNTPAIRDEIQTRGRWAHSHGRALVDELAKAHGSAEMVEVVQNHASSALTQHLQYWTLNGTSPKTDNNWKRKAEPADWYAKRIGKACNPIQKALKPEVDLETTVDYGVQQYGRYMFRWVHQLAREHDLPVEFVMEQLLMRFESRLKDEDMAWLTEGMSKRDAKKWERHVDKAKDAVAKAQEVGWFA